MQRDYQSAAMFEKGRKAVSWLHSMGNASKRPRLRLAAMMAIAAKVHSMRHAGRNRICSTIHMPHTSCNSVAELL